MRRHKMKRFLQRKGNNNGRVKRHPTGWESSLVNDRHGLSWLYCPRPLAPVQLSVCLEADYLFRHGLPHGPHWLGTHDPPASAPTLLGFWVYHPAGFWCLQYWKLDRGSHSPAPRAPTVFHMWQLPRVSLFLFPFVRLQCVRTEVSPWQSVEHIC